jgi:hypothetical protein
MPVNPDEDMRNLNVSFETFLNYTFIICAVFLTMGIEFFITILKILHDSFKNGFVSENFKSENIWRKVNRSIRRKNNLEL